MEEGANISFLTPPAVQRSSQTATTLLPEWTTDCIVHTAGRRKKKKANRKPFLLAQPQTTSLANFSLTAANRNPFIFIKAQAGHKLRYSPSSICRLGFIGDSSRAGDGL